MGDTLRPLRAFGATVTGVTADLPALVIKPFTITDAPDGFLSTETFK